MRQKLIDSIMEDGFGLYVWNVQDIQTNNGIVIRGYPKAAKIYMHLSSTINECGYYLAYIHVVKKILRRPYIELTFYPLRKK